MVVDTTNPKLYDHQYDHVPGMVVIEACRQAAVWRTQDHLSCVAAQFYAYIELDTDPILEVIQARCCTRIVVTQNGRVAAVVTFGDPLA